MIEAGDAVLKQAAPQIQPLPHNLLSPTSYFILLKEELPKEVLAEDVEMAD